MEPIGYLLAHVIMEAHRFPKEPGKLLLFPSWRTRNAAGLVRSESKTWDPEGPVPTIWGQKKMEGLSSKKDQMCSSFTLLLSSGPLETGWGPSELLSWLAQMLISFRNTLTVTFRNKVSPTIWACIGPLKLKIKLTITAWSFAVKSFFLFVCFIFPEWSETLFSLYFLRKRVYNCQDFPVFPSAHCQLSVLSLVGLSASLGIAIFKLLF